MHRFVQMFFAICAILILVTACSETTTSPDPGQAVEKRTVLPEIDDPPPGYDPFMFLLQENFVHHNWIEVQVDVLAKAGGTISVVPDGYPQDRPIEIELTGDPLAAADVMQATIWVVGPPSAGEFSYVPGNCIIYRTKDLPPTKDGTAKVRLPIMPWYDTSNFSGGFTSYDLTINQEGFPDYVNAAGTSIEWPPEDPDKAIYVEMDTITDKDDPSNIVDRAVDPDAPGD